MSPSPPAGGPAFDLSDLDDWFAAKLAGPGMGILAVVQRGDEPVAWRGWGDRHIHPGQRWNHPDSLRVPFWIASLSKHFTAYAVLRLAEEGKVDLDAPACAYLPRLARVSRTLTVRHLLDSRSGLQHDEHCVVLCGSTPEAGLLFERRLDFIYDQSHLNGPPGTQTFYQSTDFTLLGEVVEAVTGRSLDAYAREAVFGPAGMADSRYGLHYGEAYARMPGTFRVSHYGVLQHYHNNMEVLGDGSMVSSAADLVRWHRFLRRDELAGRWFERFGAFREDGDGNGLMYGCGTNRLTVAGARAYGKGGHSYAHASGFVRVPDKDLFVLVFSNQPLLTGLEMARDVADWAAARLGAAPPVQGAALPRGLPGLWVDGRDGFLVDIREGSRERATGKETARTIRFGAATAALRVESDGRIKSWGLYEFDLSFRDGELTIAFGDDTPARYERCDPVPVPVAELDELSGRFLCPTLNGLLQIRRDKAKAVLQWGPGQAIGQVLPLFRSAPDCYVASWVPFEKGHFEDDRAPRYAGAQTYFIKVERDSAGAVAALRVSNCHVRRFRYLKLPDPAG